MKVYYETNYCVSWIDDITNRSVYRYYDTEKEALECYMNIMHRDVHHLRLEKKSVMVDYDVD